MDSNFGGIEHTEEYYAIPGTLKRKLISIQQKLSIVNEVLISSLSYRELSIKYHVSISCISAWVKIKMN